ncbi:MAG: hypothetical protein O3C21_06505 [Verrucomicrobia bacterium]|nr:hypothetical protein [Verrucomicrobiota bacterium]
MPLCLVGSCLLAVVQLACDSRTDIANGQSKPVTTVGNDEAARVTNSFPKRIDDARNLSVALAEFAPEDVRRHLMESEPGQWQKWMPSFYREWGKLDGKAAMQSALAEQNELVSRAAGAVLKAWAEADIAAAQQWVELTPKGRAQIQFAGIVINNIESPRDAAEWLAQLNPENVSNLSDIVSRIGVRWISTEPLSALSWLSSMPDEKMREAATMQTFFQWSKQDPEVASAFLAQLDPEEQFYSLAAEGLSRAISMTDAEGALAWADQVTSSQRARSGLDDALLFGTQTLLRDTTDDSDEPVESPPSPLGIQGMQE